MCWRTKEGRWKRRSPRPAGECVFVRLDVTSEDSWADAVATAVSRFGKLDIVVNNAGIVLRGVLEDTSAEDWDRVMDVNAKGVFLGTKSAIPEMRKAGGGSIINISSMSGMVGQSYIQPVYNASKGAVRIFTKSAAIQYASENIRVNSVHPGPIDTPMAGERLNNPELQREADERSPLGPDGASHRGGLRSAVPGVGRVVVCDGSGVGDRRRCNGAVGLRGDPVSGTRLCRGRGPAQTRVPGRSCLGGGILLPHSENCQHVSG